MVSTKSKARKSTPKKQETVSPAMERAKRLPNPGPGVSVTVKLDVLPEWLALHGLEPILAAFPPIMHASVPLVVRVQRIGKQHDKAEQ